MNKYEGHTPGPWTIEGILPHQTLLISGDEQRIAVCDFRHYRRNQTHDKPNSLLLRDSPALASLVDEAKALVEWMESKSRNIVSSSPIIWEHGCCNRTEKDGHAPDCRLAAWLKRVKELEAK